MGRRLRLITALGMLALAAVSLTGCSPATHAWIFLGADGDLRVASCNGYSASHVRVTLQSESAPTPSQSVVWSGPPVSFSEAQPIAADGLPPGWTATAELNLDRPWQYLVVESYLYDEPTQSEWFTRDDTEAGQWALTPPSSWIYPAPSCLNPADAGSPTSIAADVWTAKDTAAVETYAMDKAQFWSIIDTVGAKPLSSPSSTLANALQALAPEAVRAFQGRLILEFVALDTAANWDHSERLREQNDRAESEPGGYFADYRCGLILRGEAGAGDAAAAWGVEEGNLPDAADILDSARVASIYAQWEWDESRVPSVPPTGSNAVGW